MRIYFFFNFQHHTLMCHEIARHWQASRGWQEYAGVMVVKEGLHYQFMQEQTDVNYHYLDTTDQIEADALKYDPTPELIAAWEKRLDCPLWHLAIADRNIGHMFVQGGLIPRTDIMKLATHENISRFICYNLEFYRKRLEAFKPDAVFFTVMASMSSLALAKVCEFLEIPYFMLCHTRILDRYTITCNNHIERFDTIEHQFRNLLADHTTPLPLPAAAQNYLESFQGENPEKPGFATDNIAIRQQVQSESWFRFGRQVIYWLIRVGYFSLQRRLQPDRYLRSIQPWSEFKWRLRQRIGQRSQQTPFSEAPRPGQERYVLFPLHLNPEASTMILAPNFVNQLTVIEALAKNIPLTHKLYIKEHPTMLGRRPVEFYKVLQAFPNIRIISAAVDNFELIRHADLIAVITGTTGWEAIMMGRPVITFGECFYANLGFSERCSDFNQLGGLLRRLLLEADEPDQSDHTARLKLFLIALFEHSFPFPNRLYWPQRLLQPPQAKQNFTRIAADRLAKLLGLSRRLVPIPEEQTEMLQGAQLLAEHLAQTMTKFTAARNNGQYN